jgi:hypothetical protein
MSPYNRTVRTASGATAVQIMYPSPKGSRDIEHIESAHTEVDVELLKTVARQRLIAGQDELDFGDRQPVQVALPIISSSAKRLWDGLCEVYDQLGFSSCKWR